MEHHEIVRSLIKSENEFIHQRLTWLGTFNGLLFTGLGFAWGKSGASPLVAIFALMGITVSLLSGVSIFAANYALHRQYDWWQKNKPAAYAGPDVIGPPRCLAALAGG